jgi:hypothetical protein
VFVAFVAADFASGGKLTAWTVALLRKPGGAQ